MVSRLIARARPLNAAAGLACLAAIAYAVLWLQMGRGLEPCPLCVVDRVAFGVAAVVFLAAAVHGPGRLGQRVYGGLALAPLGVGLASAGRHVWLQHLPAEQVPACGPSLGYIVSNFPLSQAWDLVLRGSGSCAELQWRFFGLSIPEWTLALFLVGAIWALLLLAGPRYR